MSYYDKASNMFFFSTEALELQRIGFKKIPCISS